MDRISFIKHKGKEILYIDYNGIKSQDDMMTVLYESLDAVNKAGDDLLILSNMTGASTGPDFMKVAKEKSKELAGKSKKTAIIGVTGLKKMLLKGFNLFTGEVTEPFDTKEEALEYLVS